MVLEIPATEQETIPAMEGFEQHMATLLSGAIDSFEPVFAQYGLLALFLLVMVEGCAVPAPGATILVVGGLLAGRGQMGIVPVLLTAWVAAISGGALGYALGRYGGRRLLNRLSIRGERLQKVEGFYARNTIVLLLVARFVEGLKQTAAIIAGTLEVPLARFMVGTVAGATVWVAVFGYGSYLLEHDFAAIHAFFHHTRPWFWGLSAVLLLSLLLVLWRARDGGVSEHGEEV